MTEPFKVEGVDFSSGGIAEIRAELVKMCAVGRRGGVQAVGDLRTLTHATALLSYLIELQRQHGEEERARDFSASRKQTMEELVEEAERGYDVERVGQLTEEAQRTRQRLNEFVCPAVMHHGPGHQSTTQCQRIRPHGLGDEHFALNPMQPGFSWHGDEGWETP